MQTDKQDKKETTKQVGLAAVVASIVTAIVLYLAGLACSQFGLFCGQEQVIADQAGDFASGFVKSTD